MEKLISKTAAACLEVAGRAIQTAAVLALMVVTHGDIQLTLFALVVALIWVGMPQRDLIEKAKEILIKRDLFQTLGEWLGHTDGGERVNKAYRTHLDLEAGGESTELNAVAKAQVFGGLWMSLVSLLLQVYLVVIVFQVLISAGNG